MTNITAITRDSNVEAMEARRSTAIFKDIPTNEG